MAKLTVAVLYGSRSPEHEVAIISALQVMQNLDQEKYTILPVYISKTGQWYIGNNSFLKPESYKNLDLLVNNFRQTLLNPASNQLQTASLSFVKKAPHIDVFFPVLHGSFGEDGTVQGLLEMMQTPYVGCGVLSSSVGMDKLVQKQVFSTLGIPQVNYIWFYRTQWQQNKSTVISILKSLKYPVFVKPVNGGSSIGITKVNSRSSLSDAIDVAAAFDRKIIVEESAENFHEINISVLGNSGSQLKTSVCEQPISRNGILTFKDKYQSGNSKSSRSAGMGSGGRLIPAPLKKTTTEEISRLAKLAYSGLDCSGLSRVDFLVSPDEKQIYINEINTMPGSLSYYLWEASGLSFSHLLDELIRLALERFSDRSQTTYTFSSNILQNLGRTLKGGKLKG